MRTLYGNNLRGRTSGALGTGDTTITLASPASGHADIADWPEPGAGERMWATLDNGTDREIVRVTARSGSDLTVVRGQEGTTAQSWPSGTTIDNRWISRDAEGRADYEDPPATLPASGTIGSVTTTAITDPAPGYTFAMPVAAVGYSRPVFSSGLSGDWVYRVVLQNLGLLTGFAAVGATIATSDHIYMFGLFGQNYQRWQGRWDEVGTTHEAEDIDQSLFSESHDEFAVELSYDSGAGEVTVKWMPDGFHAAPSLTETYTVSGTVAHVGVGGQGTSGAAGGQLVALLSAELL